MSKIILSKNFIKSVCRLALNEDLYPSGDITSSLLKNNINKKIKLISNQKGIIGGLEFAKQTFKLIDKNIKFVPKKKEGSSIKKGHIPGSLNLPYNLLMDTDNNFVFRSADEIITVIEVAGIKPENPLVATCGSGVTACVIALALYLVGYKDTAVYDGSWAEWGDHPITPWTVDE